MTSWPGGQELTEAEMVQQYWRKKTGALVVLVSSALLVLAVTVAPVEAARAAEPANRAAWLLNRPSWGDLAVGGQTLEQGEIGGGGDTENFVMPTLQNERSGMSGAWPILMSAVLPGAGEVAVGYKRGYAMALLDILSWTQVAKYHRNGADLRTRYIAFADAHYSDDLLVAAYAVGGQSIDGGYRANVGTDYFSIASAIDTTTNLVNLSLYVSKQDDFREYYENLGKWDQFVFGWDDFIRPDDHAGYSPVGTRDPDLKQPWISVNRGKYQVMRDDSNQAYKKRDRWLYLNIGLRLFSVFQVAYLEGLLTGGDPDHGLEVNGHEVSFQAVPIGLNRGVVSASVSF